MDACLSEVKLAKVLKPLLHATLAQYTSIRSSRSWKRTSMTFLFWSLWQAVKVLPWMNVMPRYSLIRPSTTLPGFASLSEFFTASPVRMRVILRLYCSCCSILVESLSNLEETSSHWFPIVARFSSTTSLLSEFSEASKESVWTSEVTPSNFSSRLAKCDLSWAFSSVNDQTRCSRNFIPFASSVRVGFTMVSSQYCDDTTIFGKDDSSARAAIKVVKDFGNVSGLQLHLNKCQCMWLGTRKHSKLTICGQEPVEQQKIIGVIFSATSDCSEINIQQAMSKIQTTLNQWSQRDLPLKEKLQFQNHWLYLNWFILWLQWK